MVSVVTNLMPCEIIVDDHSHILLLEHHLSPPYYPNALARGPHLSNPIMLPSTGRPSSLSWPTSASTASACTK